MDCTVLKLILLLQLWTRAIAYGHTMNICACPTQFLIDLIDLIYIFILFYFKMEIKSAAHLRFFSFLMKW